METMYGLTSQQMVDVYRHVRYDFIKNEIESYLEENSYNIHDKEFDGRDIVGHLDFDRMVTKFERLNEFNYDLVGSILEDEIYNNIDSILGN